MSAPDTEALVERVRENVTELNRMAATAESSACANETYPLIAALADRVKELEGELEHERNEIAPAERRVDELERENRTIIKEDGLVVTRVRQRAERAEARIEELEREQYQLRRELNACRELTGDVLDGERRADRAEAERDVAIQDFAIQANAIRDLEAEVAQLREALEPFSEIGAHATLRKEGEG